MRALHHCLLSRGARTMASLYLHQTFSNETFIKSVLTYSHVKWISDRPSLCTRHQTWPQSPQFHPEFRVFWVNVSSLEASPRRLLSKGVRYLAFNDSINTHISPFLRLSPFNVAFTRLINSFKYCVGEKGPLSLLLNGYLLVSRV